MKSDRNNQKLAGRILLMLIFLYVLFFTKSSSATREEQSGSSETIMWASQNDPPLLAPVPEDHPDPDHSAGLSTSQILTPFTERYRIICFQQYSELTYRCCMKQYLEIKPRICISQMPNKTVLFSDKEIPAVS